MLFRSYISVYKYTDITKYIELILNMGYDNGIDIYSTWYVLTDKEL